MLTPSFYYEVLQKIYVVVSKQVKNMVAVLAFFDQQKGSVRIAKQPTPLTESKINHPGCITFTITFSRNKPQ